MDVLCKVVGQRRSRRLVEAAQQRIEQWAQEGIVVLCEVDEQFPELLTSIPDPPRLLFLRGDLDCLAAPTVAVVGARRGTRLGLEIAHELARRLTARGFVVISGLALGIDSAAHRGALVQGRTVAVLGSGLNRVQPVTNDRLAQDILARRGLHVSEYLPEVRARPYHFPQRNRLISGLSLGVLVVEAGERSGSLITARLALEQGREVMAVPGSLGHANSKGCHRLIKQGAGLVEDAQDVVDALGVLAVTRPADEFSRHPSTAETASRELPRRLQEVCRAIGQGVTSMDEICALLSLPAMAVSAILSELEVEGFVQRVPDGYIRRPFPPN